MSEMGVDQASVNVVDFLGALQAGRASLLALREVLIRAGAKSCRPFLNLSGTPFTVQEGASSVQFDGSLALGLIVEGADGREYDLGADLLWTKSRWLIQTELWADNADGGQDLLRSLPERTAADLKSCLQQLHDAIADLASLQNVVGGTKDGGA